MSSIKENFEEGKNKIVEEYAETKEKISTGIGETKKQISDTVSSGVSKTKKLIKRLVLLAFLLGIFAAGAYLFYANWTYSNGTRTGYLVKISEKGYLFKTYEGQLNLGGFQANPDEVVIGNVWNFSLQDDVLYKQLQELEGNKVTLHYKEINKSMPWQGDTNYFIGKAEKK